MEGLQLGWLDDWLGEVATIPSPYRFKLWAGIYIVGSLLGRRVWAEIEPGAPLYANSYVMLVARPGIGKSRIMDPARKLLAAFPSVALSPDEVTRERLVQSLGEVFSGALGVPQSTFAAFVSEWGTFMPKADLMFMQMLSRLWDCPELYQREIKYAPNGDDGPGVDRLEKPVVSILAGVQPTWFQEGFPPDAFEMGLPARLLLVHSDAKPARRYGVGRAFDRDRILPGLQRIAERGGRMELAPEGLALLQSWADSGFRPFPSDPMLSSFCERRDLHVVKLALVVAISRAHQRIEVKDIEAGMALLFDIEKDMPKALAAAGGNKYRLREENVASYVVERFAATKKFVPEWELRDHIGRQFPAYMIDQMLDHLIDIRAIKSMGGAKPSRLFSPGKRKA